MLGGPAYWSFTTGFGSAGVPGWGGGIGDEWFFGSGAPNVFRYGGSYALFPLGKGTTDAPDAPSPIIPSVPTVVAAISPPVPSPAGAPILSKREQLEKEQAILEAIIAGLPIGTGTLDPIDEEKWGEIIRIPVPKPTPPPTGPIQVVDVEAIIGEPTDPSSAEQVKAEKDSSDMAIDWGTILTGIVGDVSGAAFGPSPASSFTYGKPSYTGPGPLSALPGDKFPCKRRRRRRLLTESDFNDLMRISTLPNKEGVRIALAKAIGRSR